MQQHHHSLVDCKQTVSQLFKKIEMSGQSDLISPLILCREILELVANELFSLKFNQKTEQLDLEGKIQMLDIYRTVPVVISVHMNVVAMLTDEILSCENDEMSRILEPCVSSTRVIVEWYKN